MPNLIHSLDASNIHLLIKNLNNIPIFTIHDCFATLPNDMKNLELLVKRAFIEIYFLNDNYLEKMHENIVNQIKSYTLAVTDSKGIEHINIKGKDYVIPQIPESFTNKDVMNIFIKGLLKSKNLNSNICKYNKII